MTRLFNSALSAALILSIAAAGPAFAAGSGSGAGNASASAPSATTETFGDWTLRCSAANAAPAGKAQAGSAAVHCEIAEPIVAKGQNRPVAVVAVGPAAPGGAMRLVAQVPVGAWIPTTPTLTVGANDPVELSYKRCFPRACLASVDLANDLRDKMKAETKGGKITFSMNPGQVINLPITFKGFTAAYDALLKKPQ